MGTYELSEKDKANPNNKKLEGSPTNFGVNGSRSCTDVLFLLLLVLAWAAMTGLGLVVVGAIDVQTNRFHPGNPERLLNGIDASARICGVDAAVKTRKRLFPLPSGDGACVTACPSKTNYERFICSNDTIQAIIYEPADDSFDVEAGMDYVTAGDCMFEVASTDILKYCIYTAAMAAANATADGIDTSFTIGNSTLDTSDFENLVADVIVSRNLLLGIGLGGSCVFGFVYLFLLRIPGLLFTLVWGIMFAIWAALIGAGVMLKINSDSWANEPVPKVHSTDQTKALEYLAYVMFGLAALWTLLSLWLRKRIQIAIAITKESSKAVNNMKAIVLFPVLQCFALAVFLVPWSVYAVYLASSGEITVVNGVKQFNYSDDIRYAGLYLLFIYFWTSEFVVALGQIVVAMSVATWYFTRDKRTISSGTVIRSIGKSMWYHSGTAAFGSLIIAIIKTIRTVIAYLQKKAKASKNKLLMAALCCLQCCMWCLEKFMKFLNKNAYVQTAIFGYSFCKASRKAFFLIARNILRVAAVGMVSELVALLGLILIPLASALAYYLAADKLQGDELHGLIGPTLIVALLAYFMARMFTDVFAMAISTILQCFIADEEMFEPQDRFAEGSLTVAVNNNSKQGHHLGSKGVEVQPSAPAGKGELP